MWNSWRDAGDFKGKAGMPMETGAGQDRTGAYGKSCEQGEALYLFQIYNIQQIFMDLLSV